MKTKSALPWFGSDSEVAGDLAAMLDHCKHVTIPFAGGLSILPHLTARAIVANDLHNDAITFYRVASGSLGCSMQSALLTRCEWTLSHPDELEAAKEELNDPDSTLGRRAWAFWALCWIGRKGKGGTKQQGGMPSVRRTANGGTNASRIKAAAGDLVTWAEHFGRCEWESVCFRKLLPAVADRDECGVYCDPPWVKAGRDYRHTFTERDHRDLRELLGRFERTTVVVRYGDDPLIRQLYDGWDFTMVTSRTQANQGVQELRIVNSPAWARLMRESQPVGGESQ